MRQGLQLLLGGILLLSGSCAYGQAFGAGVFGGLSAAQVDGDNLSGFDKPGANLGLFTYINLGEHSDLQLELSWVQKGARKEPSDTNPNTYRSTLNYLSIPIIYRYYLGDFSLEIGPAIDILVSASEEWNGLVLPPTDPPYHRVNLAGMVGFNYHFSEQFYLSFRSVNSLIPIRPGNAPTRLAGPRFGGFGQRNIVLTFGLYWRLKAPS